MWAAWIASLGKRATVMLSTHRGNLSRLPEVQVPANIFLPVRRLLSCFIDRCSLQLSAFGYVVLRPRSIAPLYSHSNGVSVYTHCDLPRSISSPPPLRYYGYAQSNGLTSHLPPNVLNNLLELFSRLNNKTEPAYPLTFEPLTLSCSSAAVA